MIVEKPLKPARLRVLKANYAAAAAVREYGGGDKWPPTNLDVVSAYLDLVGLPRNSKVDKDDDYTERYYRALNEAHDAPFDVLVQDIADAASKRKADRRMAQALRRASASTTNVGAAFDGWPSPGRCAQSEYEYLLVASAAWRDSVGLLLAVPWSGDPPIAIGRQWNRLGEAKRLQLPGNMSAPDPSTLPLALRPYASVIPVLVSEAADAHSYGRWGGGGYMTEEEAEAECVQRKQNKTVFERALAPLLSQLEPLAACSELPPKVMRVLQPRPSTGSLYAWFNECQLVAGLGVALGRGAAAAARPYATMLRAPCVPAAAAAAAAEGAATGLEPLVPPARISEPIGREDADSGDDDDDRDGSNGGGGGGGSSGGVGGDGGPVQTPNTLAALARALLAPMGTSIDWDALPPMLCDSVGFDVWQSTCNVPPSRRRIPASRFAPLVSVARAWGIEPDEAETQEPELLCGRLAHEAIMRGMPGRPELQPDAARRSGVPSLRMSENRAIEAVCHSDAATAFERADSNQTAALVVDAFRVTHQRKPKEADAPLVTAVANLVNEANTLYCVAPGSVAYTPLGVRTQIDVAMAALRSGVLLTPDDLANAGRACIALTPTAALAP